MKQEQLIASLKEIERLAAACLAALNDPLPTMGKATPKAHPVRARRSTAPAPDFTSQIRHFTNKHAKGMNGQQKFTLVLAYFAKGKPNTEIKLETVRDAWNGMKGLLGKFNTGYATRAKDNGWVDSPKAGVYVLLTGWTEILNHNA